MFGMIFAGFFMIFSVNMFYTNFTYMGVYRAYLGIYKGVAEVSVVAYGEDGMAFAHPLFDCDLFEENVRQYYAASLSKYIKTYDLSFSYPDYVVLNYKTWAKKARATLTCTINGFSEKSFVASFEIIRSSFDGE